jgi:hypothetical protein
MRTKAKMPKMRGGNHGGGTTIYRLELQSDKAARELRRRATITGARYRKPEANAAVTQILELLADGRLIFVPDDMLSAVSWLYEARRLCFDETARRGLDHLIAALEIARAVLQRDE